MQALGRKRLHLAPELLSKRPKAMHLTRNAALPSCFWQQRHSHAAHTFL